MIRKDDALKKQEEKSCPMSPPSTPRSMEREERGSDGKRKFKKEFDFKSCIRGIQCQSPISPVPRPALRTEPLELR